MGLVVTLFHENISNVQYIWLSLYWLQNSYST